MESIGIIRKGDIASDIGARIRELRGRLGLSQGDFAALFSRSYKQVSSWENGHQRPPAAVLVRTATTQGWPIEIFREGGKRPAALVDPPGDVRGQAPDMAMPFEVAFSAASRLRRVAENGMVPLVTALQAVDEIQRAWAADRERLTDRLSTGPSPIEVARTVQGVIEGIERAVPPKGANTGKAESR